MGPTDGPDPGSVPVLDRPIANPEHSPRFNGISLKRLVSTCVHFLCPPFFSAPAIQSRVDRIEIKLVFEGTEDFIDLERESLQMRKTRKGGSSA
jgi:hypothetical protein